MKKIVLFVPFLSVETSKKGTNKSIKGGLYFFKKITTKSKKQKYQPSINHLVYWKTKELIQI